MHPCCRKLVLSRCLETDQPVALHLHEARTLLPHSRVSHPEYNNCQTHSRWEGKFFISLKALELSAYNDSSFFFPSLNSSADHYRVRVIVALDHTQWHTYTPVRIPLYERSALRRGVYLTIHNTHNRQTTMPPTGFEPAISAIERPHTYALDWNDSITQICLVDELVNWIGWAVEWVVGS